MEGKKNNCEEGMNQNQGAGKGQKLASGTTPGKGSVQAASTAEFLLRDRHQGAEGFSEEGIWTGVGSEQGFKAQHSLSKLHSTEVLPT